MPFPGGSRVWNLVNFQPVDAAFIGENQQIGMRGRDDQMLDHVLGARGHADAAFAAARLAAVGIDRGALQITAARHRDRDVFHLYQVFEPDFAGILDDLGAALVAEFLLDFFQFLDDHAAQDFFRTQDFQILCDPGLNFGQLIDNLLLFHTGQALELQFDDGLRLRLTAGLNH